MLLSLSPSYGKVRVLGAVIVAQSTWSMQFSEPEIIERRSVGSQSIGDDELRL